MWLKTFKPGKYFQVFTPVLTSGGLAHHDKILRNSSPSYASSTLPPTQCVPTALSNILNILCFHPYLRLCTLILEKGKEWEREKEGEGNTSVKEKHWACWARRSGNWTSSLGTCPHLGWNPQPSGGWDDTLVSWATQPGLKVIFLSRRQLCLQCLL